MTAGTALRVKLIEVFDLSGRAPAFSFSGLTGETPTAACQQSDGYDHNRSEFDLRSRSHRSSSSSGITPGASTPARAANGHDCAVSTSFECATTKPVINPNATCDAMNHPQAIFALSAGLISRKVEAT